MEKLSNSCAYSFIVSNRFFATSAIQVIVVDIVDSFSSDHLVANDIGNFSSRPMSDPPRPYVTAQFDFESCPKSFVIGDDKLYDGYWNMPLQPGREYAVAIKTISIGKQVPRY